MFAPHPQKSEAILTNTLISAVAAVAVLTLILSGVIRSPGGFRRSARMLAWGIAVTALILLAGLVIDKFSGH